MSLLALSQQKNREQDEMFLSQTEELAASEVRPEPEGLVGRHEAMIDRIKRAAQPQAEESAASGAEPVSEGGADRPEEQMARREQEGGEGDPPVIEEAAAPAQPVTPPPAGTEPVTPDPDASNAQEGPGLADERATTPEGIPEGVIGVPMTEEDRVAAIAGERTAGSIADGGSAEDMIAGLPPRPSVASQREIRDFHLRRIGDLEVRRPANWPDFMTFPTYAELRALQRPEITPEEIRDFEEFKQGQADEMEARARELNAWIFSFGDGRMNARHLKARDRNRDAALLKRAQPISKSDDDLSPPRPEDVTDQELYKDRHYGIRFGLLLKSGNEQLEQLRQLPVAAWGHDMIRTLDGGRIRATDDEIRITTVSMQAAHLMVMEAKARGWETIRVSGDNEFCAAIKQACKENGMGAIIKRRGPLGLGPFSRAEVVMPQLPDPLGARLSGSSDQERAKKERAAPAADRDAAAGLLGDGAQTGPGPDSPQKGTPLDKVDVSDPLDQEKNPAPRGRDQNPVQDGPE